MVAEGQEFRKRTGMAIGEVCDKDHRHRRCFMFCTPAHVFKVNAFVLIAKHIPIKN